MTSPVTPLLLTLKLQVLNELISRCKLMLVVHLLFMPWMVLMIIWQLDNVGEVELVLVYIRVSAALGYALQWIAGVV